MQVTLAHKDSLKFLKGYPIIIEPGDLLFSFDTGTLGIDAHGNRLYPKEDVSTTYFAQGPFNQGSTIIEKSTQNLISDSVFDDISNWSVSPSGEIKEDDIYKPFEFSGSEENSIYIHSSSAQSLSINSNDFIPPSSITTGDKIIQSCWIKTDANAIRFVYDSSSTGQHYDDYVTILSQKWQHIEAANPYTITSSDISGQIKQFYLETSSNATYLYIFRPQTEVNTFSTSWTKTTRGDGKLIYSRSYFTPKKFSLMFWFKINHYPLDYAAIMSICHSDSDFQRIIIYIDSNKKLIFKGSNKNIQLFNVTSPTDIELNQWRHGAITYDSKTYKFYLNGNIISKISETRLLDFDMNASLFIGTHNSHNILNGFLNDVLLSNRLFDELTIRYIYEGGQPLYNPMAYVGQL